MSKVKLHLGCGERDFGEDWVHIDGGDFPHLHSHDVTRLPFEDESVDPKEETRRRNFEKILRENAKAKIARGLEGLMRLNPTAKRRIT